MSSTRARCGNIKRGSISRGRFLHILGRVIRSCGGSIACSVIRAKLLLLAVYRLGVILRAKLLLLAVCRLGVILRAKLFLPAVCPLGVSSLLLRLLAVRFVRTALAHEVPDPLSPLEENAQHHNTDNRVGNDGQGQGHEHRDPGSADAHIAELVHVLRVACLEPLTFAAAHLATEPLAVDVLLALCGGVAGKAPGNAAQGSGGQGE
mmetsp:Transcript_124603/g.363840  ORF Transcript_124603/g.363840 Transcript_124603/m.363840 type:complete len:206 (-) Transcript_124603:401-1018(-)